MKILAFETATPSGGVALLIDGVVVGEMRVTNPQAHSRLCLSFAEQLLQTAGLKWPEIDIYATSHGPGSFTGVRIGLTLVKGLAYANGKPAVSVSSLESLAFHAWSHEEVEFIVPLIDARMKEIYGAVYRPVVTDGQLVLETVVPEFCLPPAEIIARVGGRALFAGEGARHYPEIVEKCEGVLARADRLLASPGATAALAWREAKAGRLQDANQLDAVYLREAIQGGVR